MWSLRGMTTTAGSPLSERFAICAALAAVLLVVPASAARADADFTYLTEIVCEAAPGAPLVPMVLAQDCARPRLRGAADIVAVQRHDWPAAQEAQHRPQGYQRSISYAAQDRNGRKMAVQIFDFGGGDRRFGAFDAGRGDGGQVAVITSGAAHVSMTEDGTGGVQWFTGSSCRGETDAIRSGWLLFSQNRGTSWQSSVAALRTTRTSAECPTAFDASYTRWREVQIDWPVLFDGVRDPARPELPQVATIISEHFGGAQAAQADHMERFYLADGIGLIRWERWEQAGRSQRPELAERAGRLVRSGRCPEVEGSTPPAENWRRVDCRNWTNFVNAPDKASGFDWREATGGRQ
jgi:hypothetical protein